MSKATGSTADRTTQSEPIPMLEWIISGLGLVLVAASLVFVLYKASFDESKPPDIHAKLLGSRSASHGYVATVELRNAGGQTAAELQVVARLADRLGESERQATLDFLPPHSTRQVEFCFREFPTADNFSLEFISFQIP